MVNKIIQNLVACMVMVGFSLSAQNALYVPLSITSVYAGSQTRLYIEDLWHLVITGEEEGASPDKYYRIKMTVIDKKRGDLLLQQWSWSFRMVEPVYYIDVQEVNAWGKVDLTVLQGDWWQIVNSSGGSLPHGSYEVQIEIFETNKECTWTGITLLSETFSLDIMPFFELLLIYPENGDTLNSVDFFSWEEVSGQPVLYQVKVVRIEDPEMATQLIESVNPIWQSAYLSDKLWNTTDNTPSLEEGWYAWYVRVFDIESRRLITTSEIRTFYYRVTNADYLRLGKGTYYYIDLATEGLHVSSDTITLVFKGECVEEPKVFFSSDGIYYKPIEFMWEPMVPEQSITLYKSSLGAGYLRISQCSQEYLLQLKGLQSRTRRQNTPIFPKRR